MSGHSVLGGETSWQFLLESDTQALASFASMQSPLAELPPEAYTNLPLVSTKSPGDVEYRLDELGIPVSNVGLIPLAGSDYDYDGPLWTSDTVRPNDPTGISIAFTEALENLIPNVGYVLVENLNVLAMYVDEETVCRLLTYLASMARKRNVTGIYGVVRSAISDETYSNFRQAVDREIDCQP